MRTLAAAALLAAAVGLWAAEGPSGVRLVSPADADWRPPTELPPGAEYLLIREDPVTHGIQAIVRFPAGYEVPPHSLSCAETLVMLKGKLGVEAAGAARTLKPGDYAFFPAGAVHTLRAAGWGRAVFTITTDGPFELKPAAAAPR